MIKKILKPIGAIVFVALAIYLALFLTSGNTLPSSARINSVHCGNMTAEEATNKIAKEFSKFKPVSILKDDDEDLGEITPKYHIDKIKLKEKLTDIIKQYRLNLVLWYKLANNYKTNIPFLDDNCHQKMMKKLKKLDGNHYSKKTKDAYLDYDLLKIKKEIYGNDLDFEKIENDFAKDMEKGESVFVYYENESLKKPQILSDNQQLKNELKFTKKYLKGGLDIGINGQTYHISNKTLRSIIVPDQEKEATVNVTGIDNVIKNYTRKYNLNKNVTVKLHGKKVSLKDRGNVQKVDVQKTSSSIEEAAESKINGNLRTAQFYYMYNKFDYTKNYIEVSIKKQKLYYYKNGKLKMSCNVVTGKPPRHSTPTGAFSIMWKEKNTVLRGFEDDGSRYASPVSNWMPLTDEGVGLHDANWRGAFGGNIYKYDGSHGCINMPPSKATWLFNHVPEKYPVFVY